MQLQEMAENLLKATEEHTSLSLPFPPSELQDNSEYTSKFKAVIDTPYGLLNVTVEGDVQKPAIFTYHDIGMNHMEALVPLFCWYHIDAPGQEENADNIVEGSYPTITELAEQLEFVTQHFCLSHMIGIGVGTGANVLARYSILSPEKVRGLILINLSPGGLTWTNMNYYTSKVMGWLLKRNRMQETVKNYFLSQTLRGSQSDLDLVSNYQLYFEKQNPHNLALLLDAYSKRTSLTTDFANESRCSNLFIVSGDFEDSKEIEELNSKLDPTKSTFLKIPDSGGLVLEEQPQKVAHALQLFLQGLGHASTLGIQPIKSIKSTSEQLTLQGVAIGQELS